MSTEPIQITLLVAKVFEKLAIPYFVGGSLATAIYGISRATLDVDLVADMTSGDVEPFVAALQDGFFVDPEMIRKAVAWRESFNILHRESMFKVDVFIRKDRDFDRSQFERCQAQMLSQEPESRCFVASPEDNILAKLEWYQLGGEVSDRQWRDIQSMLKTQRERLDRRYLNAWADQLGVRDLLDKAIEEANLQT